MYVSVVVLSSPLLEEISGCSYPSYVIQIRHTVNTPPCYLLDPHQKVPPIKLFGEHRSPDVSYRFFNLIERILLLVILLEYNQSRVTVVGSKGIRELRGFPAVSAVSFWWP